MAPLTGIAFASNWLISNLKLKFLSVKTTRMTTNICLLVKGGFKHFALCADRSMWLRSEPWEELCQWPLLMSSPSTQSGGKVIPNPSTTA